MTLASLMVHTMDVYTGTIVRDSKGGQTEAYTLTHNDVPCFVQPNRSTVDNIFQSRDESITHKVYYIDDTVSLSFDDRIVFDSQNYRVVSKQNALEFNRYYRADLVLEQGAV